MTSRDNQNTRPDRAPRSLSVRDVAVHFGGVRAVDGVTLEISGARIFGLLGPNGSGKSTLLAGITRLVDLTAGELLIDGEEYHSAKAFKLAKWGLARTFQIVRLLPHLTVEGNVLLGADARYVAGLARGWKNVAREATYEAIERAGITAYAQHYPQELSYGIQRRVEIARAISMRPSFLLLDEPTAGMNAQEREDISELLRNLRSEGLTQLLIEHDVQMMIDTCDYLYAMDLGKLIAEGSPVEVVREPSVQEAYLGNRGETDA